MNKLYVQFCGKQLCALGWDVQSGADTEGTEEKLRQKKKKKLTVLTAARESIIYHVGAHGEE